MGGFVEGLDKSCVVIDVGRIAFFNGKLFMEVTRPGSEVIAGYPFLIRQSKSRTKHSRLTHPIYHLLSDQSDTQSEIWTITAD